MTEVKYNLGDGEIIAEYDENGIAKITRECFEMLIEKQIPKKPLIRYENMGFGVSPNENIKIYGCPCCKEDTDGATYFCQNCGQKLDWSDEE